MDTFAKRVLTVIAAVLLLFYVGYHVFMSVYSPLTLQTAELYDEYETIETEGIVVRRETMIPAPKSGYAYYIAENGSRVAKDGKIVDLYKNQDSALAQQRLKELDEEILRLRSIQDQGQNNRTNLSIISTQLKNIQAQLVAEMSSPHYTQMEELSAEMLSLMNKQKITVGKELDFSDRIAELTAERNSLESINTTPISSITSDVAGYFVNSVDGFESLLDTETVAELTAEDIRNAMTHEADVDNSQYIGKVVSGYEWYLACVISAEHIVQLTNSTTLRVRLPFTSSDIIPVTVVAENRDRNGDIAIILRCDYMSAELSDIRIEQVQLLVEQHSGLRVPDEAIRFNDDQESGVFVQEGNILYFRRIQVIYHSDKESYSICAVINDKSYLQMYDDIVLEGKDLYDGKIVSGS